MQSNYLHKPWSEITREERLFCSHLYHHIKDPMETKNFISWLNRIDSPVKNEGSFSGFVNKLSLNIEDSWEAGFEVCFYRDFLKSHKIGVKEHRDELVKVVGEDNVNNLIKRTFDLALFSKDTIVIIEAKAAEGLNMKQFEEFERDSELLSKIFNYLNIKSPPVIRYVILAKSKYFKSKSFRTHKGIGKIKLIDTQGKDQCKVNALISWEQLHSFKNDPVWSRAEEC